MQVSVSVDPQIVGTGNGLPTEDQLRGWASAALNAIDENSDENYELSVRLVGEDESRALNERYRNRSSPTNVLSFPFEGMAGLPAGVVRPLGDLVICEPVMRREAQQQNKLTQHHWAHLVVHGVLHLLGYDHELDDEAAAMEALEVKILQEFGIQNPYYSERAHN